MHRLTSERGAVLMHVILATIMLLGINVFVVDYGVMWVGRNQAQNAADAGAFAGAIALAYDNFDDRTDTGPAKVFAWQASQQNFVWGQAPKVDITSDVTFPVIPNDPCADTTCVRVDVYRDNAGANPLPSLFGGAVGVTGSGVRAMAIARWGAANASDCLKPFAIPDKWVDNFDNDAPIDTTWTTDDHFDTVYPKGYPKSGPIVAPDKADVYVAPSKTSTGTGFTLANDLGTFVTLKYGSPQETSAPGNYLPVDLPLPGGTISKGGKDYSNNISNCNAVPIAIGDVLQSEPGGMQGPTKSGIKDLIAEDPKATWDPVNNRVINSCAQSGTCSPARSTSPRIVAIPIYDTGFYETGRQNGRIDLKIVNILGFFVNDIDNGPQPSISGWLTSVPGLFDATKPVINKDSGFSKVIMLVR